LPPLRRVCLLFSFFRSRRNGLPP